MSLNSGLDIVGNDKQTNLIQKREITILEELVVRYKYESVGNTTTSTI